MPSTTIIAQPAQLMPAYNPIKYIINNTNKNEPGFRYIFTINPANVATQIAQYKTLPVYSTGYGEMDISKLMQALVTWKFDLGQSDESWYQYDIDLGFEYISNINYTISLENNAGNVRIKFAAHGFVANDQILIVQSDGGVANPGVEGLHTVLSATANNFTINALWADVTNAAIDGEVTYADFRKTITPKDVIIQDREVFNGAYNNLIFNTGGVFPVNSYLGVTSPQIALTTLTPNDSTARALMTPDQIFYLLARVYTGSYDVIYYDIAGTSLGTTNYSCTEGLHNFEINTTDHSITEDFYVEIVCNFGAEPVFGPYYFAFDNRCAINDDVLYYLDRMGSWQSFAFQLKTYEKGQITREMYNQHVDGTVVSTKWQQGEYAMGNRSYNPNVMMSFDLNTNWMDQYNATRFQELLTSPQVFYSATGIDCACTVDATGFENFRQRNKNLIKQSVSIKLALNSPING
jgi:hypothetical protein